MTTDMILLDVDIADLASVDLRTEGFGKEALVIDEELAYYMDRKRTAKQEREDANTTGS